MEYVLLCEHAVICDFQFSLNVLLYHNIRHGVLKQHQHDKFLQLNVCSVLSVIFGTLKGNIRVSERMTFTEYFPLRIL